MDFDYSYNGIVFEMMIEFHDDANVSMWTDVEFSNTVGDIKSIEADGQIVMNQIDVDDFIITIQERIRQQAFEHFQDMQKDDPAIDKACAEYHAMKEGC